MTCKDTNILEEFSSYEESIKYFRNLSNDLPTSNLKEESRDNFNTSESLLQEIVEDSSEETSLEEESHPQLQSSISETSNHHENYSDSDEVTQPNSNDSFLNTHIFKKQKRKSQLKRTPTTHSFWLSSSGEDNAMEILFQGFRITGCLRVMVKG